MKFSNFLTELEWGCSMWVNPVRAGIVSKASDYLYSSASNYLEKESLIEIDLLDMTLVNSGVLEKFKNHLAHW